MEQEAKKRIRRSKEEIAQDKIQKLEEKIADWESKIAAAKKEIEELKNPPVVVVKFKDVKAKADELGVSPEDLMKAVEKLAKKN